MTDAEHVAVQLAEVFGLDAVKFVKARSFCDAVDAAVRVLTPEQIVAAVVEQGGMGGAANPYGVVIARLRRLPDDLALRRQLSEGCAERARWAAAGRAARRGETLGELVATNQLEPDEAESMLRGELADSELLAIALDGLRGHT